MFWEFIVPLLIVLVVCYYSMPKFRYGVDCQLNKTNLLVHELTLNNLHNEFGNNDYNYKSKINNKNNKNNKKTKLKNISPELRLDTCSAMKTEACPIGSYKQCTNNVMDHPKCDCSDQKSFEVCSNNDMNDLLHYNTTQNIKYADYRNNKCATTITDAYATRVNKWLVEDTEFNEPGNLHIQRKNPYV